MNNYFICIVLLLFSTSCMQTGKTKVDLMSEMHQVDSLSYLSDNETLSNHILKNLIPLFHLYDDSKKAKILKYLTKSKDHKNFLLAEELISKNHQKINKCDLGTAELITYHDKYNNCNANGELSKIDWNKIYEDDQKYRRLFNEYGSNPQKADSITRLMLQQDSINREFVKSLMTKHTLKEILASDCDCSASKSIFYVAQHSDMDIDFRKEILGQVSKSKFYPKEHIASLIDRQLTNENKKQKFGTQLNFNPDSNRFESSPIEDMNRIDSLRYEYNLPKLSVYLKFANIRLK